MLHKRNPQLNKNGELIHLLSIEGLPRDIVRFATACQNLKTLAL